MKNTLLLIFLCLALHAHGQPSDLNQSMLDSLVRESQRTNSNALLVYKDNQLRYKNYFGNAVKPIEAMSASKSVVSMAIGLLVDQGLLKSIDEPVHRFYPEWKQGNKQHITVRHLLNHTSGLQNLTNAGIEIEVAPDVIQLALCAELESMPGEKFSYNNKASNLLPGIVERASGQPMDKFLLQHLFKPMGIRNFSWLKDKKGNPLGMSGFQVLPEDFAKLGLLIQNKGNWNGKQLLSEQWVGEMLHPSDLDDNYGYEWWLLHERQALVIDDVFLAPLLAAGDTTGHRFLQRLKGRYDGGINEMRTKAMQTYTREELQHVGKTLAAIPQSSWKFVNNGTVIGYAASGYLGQNLIIIPAKKLVVVRMITADNFKQVPNNSQLPQFKALVRDL